MAESIPLSETELPRLTDSISIGVLARVVRRETIEEVLGDTCRKERRVRLLPAHVVVYFVIAMAIFQDGYEEVMRRLVGGLQFMRAWGDDWVVPTTGAVTRARSRLGEAPMKLLFDRVARPLAREGTPGAWLGGRRLMAIDGVQIDVPDTPANAAEFGIAVGGTRRPFPQIRVVGLGECASHAVVAAQIGGIHTGERELARDLAGHVSPDMLIIADRGFYSFEFWQHYLVTGADLLWRVNISLNLPVEKVLDDGSFLSTIATHKVRGSGYQIPLSAVDDPRDATHIPVRVIEYTVEGSGSDKPEFFRLITSILDPGDLSSVDLAAAYHERWEYEISLREIETQLLRSDRGLRSKSPEMVRQELWGLLLAHYGIRALMMEAADNAGLDPDRLSFIRSLNVVRRQVTDQAAFSPLTARPGSRRHHRGDSRQDE
jgi:Insertion element 4 transposase N-terminal/Transposase DDE domain